MTIIYTAPRAGASSTVLQGAIFTGLNAALVGAVDNLVSRFAAAPVQVGAVPIAEWMTFVNDVASGTVLTILQPGLYRVVGWVPFNGGFNVAHAITVDATLAQRQSGNPNAEPNAPEVERNRFKLATTLQDLGPEASVVIDSDEIAAGANTIRLHTWNPAAGISAPLALAAYLNTTSPVLRIERSGDAN